jgi:transporter family-2 protein
MPAVREPQLSAVLRDGRRIGALFVFAQSFTVALLGVALFTVAAVTGQTLSGLLVDRMGIGPGGSGAITGVRVLGSILTVAAVAWAVSPRFGRGIRHRLAGAARPLAAGWPGS